MAHRIHVVACLLAGLAVAGAALAQQAQPPATVVVPQRLLTEEQRQMQSGQRLEMVSERARLLVEDLRSNNLFRETQGERLVEIGTVTTDVNKTNVPPATDYLRQARLQLARLRPNLDGAEKEITEIITKLDRLLRENQNKTEVDQMLADLKVIIRRQEQVRQDTAEWGKQVLQNVGDTEPQRREIQQNQNELTRKIEDFGQRLQKTAQKAQQDPAAGEKLQKADQVMQERKPQQTSREAAQQVEEKKPVQAAEKQDKTLEALREMAKALGDEESDALAQKDAAAELQKMLEQQNALDAQMQAADQFEQQAQQFQLDQAALQAALEALMQNVNAQALQQALQAMQAAQQALQQGQKPDNAAANALQQALAQMQAAQQQADAQQGDQQQQQGQPEQGQPQQGQPHAAQPTPNPSVMPMPSQDPMEGPRLFALSDKVRGDTAERSASRHTPLAPRQRESLFENYASDLPMEYRSLLREYYQVLSE